MLLLLEGNDSNQNIFCEMFNLTPMAGLVVLNPQIPVFLLETLQRDPFFMQSDSFRSEIEI